jgi:hypothetical protein
MDPTSVNSFLDEFLAVADAGFGFVAGDVTYVLNVLIIISLTLAAAQWVLAGDPPLAPFIRKILFVGFFAFLINNWQFLASAINESGALLGIRAGGSAITIADLHNPGRVAQIGIDLFGRTLALAEGMNIFSDLPAMFTILLSAIFVMIGFFILADRVQARKFGGVRRAAMGGFQRNSVGGGATIGVGRWLGNALVRARLHCIDVHHLHQHSAADVHDGHEWRVGGVAVWHDGDCARLVRSRARERSRARSTASFRSRSVAFDGDRERDVRGTVGDRGGQIVWLGHQEGLERRDEWWRRRTSACWRRWRGVSNWWRPWGRRWWRRRRWSWPRRRLGQIGYSLRAHEAHAG